MIEIKKSKALLSGVSCLVVGLVMILSTKFAAIDLISGPVDLYSLPAAELEGKFVKADIYMILDQFAYYSSGSYDTSTMVYYTIPLASEDDYFADLEEGYIAIGVPSGIIEQADALYEETTDYLWGWNDGTTSTFTVEGSVQQMDSELLDYYSEFFTYMDIEDKALPLLLEVNTVKGIDIIYVVILTAVGLILILSGLVILIRASTGKKVSDIPETSQADNGFDDSRQTDLRGASSEIAEDYHRRKSSRGEDPWD